MNTEELTRRLASPEGMAADGASTENAAQRLERYFVFRAGDSLFALLPSSIREIVPDLEVYPLPACPPYVPGLVNCHGRPFAAIDLRVLFESEHAEASQFLVLNLPGDDVAIGCTEVVEIAELPESAVSQFAEKDAESRFCTAMLSVGDDKVPLLSIPAILEKLERDLVR